MPKIMIHNDTDSSATSVSNIFIDEYMSDANGEFVKIYLYLLRLMNTPDSSVSLSSIADKFEHTEKDVKRALSYWEKMRLLRLEYDAEHNLTGVTILDSVEKNSSFSETDSSTEAAVDEAEGEDPSLSDSDLLPMRKSYTPDEIAVFRENDQIAELLFIAERYLKRTLTSIDVDTLLYLYDGLHFSTELIEYLIEYCVTKDRSSIHYIQSVALNWAKAGITSVVDAKREAQLHSQAYFAVKKAFGISNRDLVSSEMDYIEKWKKDYGFSLELISAACERTIQSVHQPSFPYTDTILKNWKKQQVHNLNDINRLDSAHQSKRNAEAASGNSSDSTSKNKFNNFKQRSYDYDQLEQMLLTTNTP